MKYRLLLFFTVSGLTVPGCGQEPARRDTGESLSRREMNRGLELLKACSYAEAIACFHGLMEKASGTEAAVVAAYNIACAYALSGDRERGLQWLKKATGLGFSDFEYLDRDPDLRFLRGDGRFGKLVREGRTLQRYLSRTAGPWPADLSALGDRLQDPNPNVRWHAADEIARQEEDSGRARLLDLLAGSLPEGEEWVFRRKFEAFHALSGRTPEDTAAVAFADQERLGKTWREKLGATSPPGGSQQR